MERAYTVSEIDKLRVAVRTKYVYGSTYFPPPKPGETTFGRQSLRSYSQGEVEIATEERLRSYMLAGITAEDIYEQDKPKEEHPQK